MTIAFLSRDFTGQFPYLRPGGCGWYRCALPMAVCGAPASFGLPEWDPIRGFGVRETVGSGVFGYKRVMLKLIMDRSTPRMIEIAKTLGQRIFTDVDDFYEGLTEANRAFNITNPEVNKFTNRDIYGRVIQDVDVVTVSTPFLLEHYSKQRDNVYMVRNAVSLSMFTRVIPNKKPVIGWAGATSYRNNDLEQLSEWLPQFLEDYDLTFHHAGHDPNAPSFAELTGVDPRRIRTSPLVTLDQYPSGLTFDIGIVPLNDIPFNHAKSNIKGLEYVAGGIPFVASDLPEYRVLHEAGVGLIARTADDWVNALTTLLPVQHRRKVSHREYEIVKRDWSIEARASEWQDVFSK